jgi:hypothetical protein
MYFFAILLHVSGYFLGYYQEAKCLMWQWYFFFTFKATVCGPGWEGTSDPGLQTFTLTLKEVPLLHYPGCIEIIGVFWKTIFSQILNRNIWCYYHLKEECLQFHWWPRHPNWWNRHKTVTLRKFQDTLTTLGQWGSHFPPALVYAFPARWQ